MDPRNCNELMSQAAEALHNGDGCRLEELLGVVDSWMQDEESAQAQRAMLEAMLESHYMLADLEA